MDKDIVSDNCLLFHNNQRFDKNKQIYIDKGKIAYNALYVDKMHFHDFFELEFVIDGHAKQNLNGNIYPLKKGIIYLLTTSDLHKYCFAENESIHYVSVQFTNDFLSKEAVACMNANKGAIVADVAEEFDYFYILLNNLHALYHNTDPVSVALMRALLETICLTLIKKGGRNPAERPVRRMNEVISYIQNNYRKHLTLRILAEKFGLTPNYLGQLFYKETQMTVLQFIKRNRLLMAASLIRNTNLTFTSIAYEVGFSSPDIFCREFRKCFHMSPTAYRSTESKIN